MALSANVQSSKLCLENKRSLPLFEHREIQKEKCDPFNNHSYLSLYLS